MAPAPRRRDEKRREASGSLATGLAVKRRSSWRSTACPGAGTEMAFSANVSSGLSSHTNVFLHCLLEQSLADGQEKVGSAASESCLLPCTWPCFSEELSAAWAAVRSIFQGCDEAEPGNLLGNAFPDHLEGKPRLGGCTPVSSVCESRRGALGKPTLVGWASVAP